MSQFILRYRLTILLSILILSIASALICLPKVSKSYDYTNAMPKGSQSELAYRFLKSKFPNQGTYVVLGIQDSQLLAPKHFNALQKLIQDLHNIPHIANILSITNAIKLLKNETTQSFQAQVVFQAPFDSSSLNKAKAELENLPIYKNILYNPQTHSYLLLAQIKDKYVFSSERDKIIHAIDSVVALFDKKITLECPNCDIKLSGMPYIRTKISDIISSEMTWLILGSTLFLLLIIALAFRSWLQLLSVFCILGLSIIYTFSSLVWFGYEINILTAIIPPLIIIIGIPNCVYFFHKYNKSYAVCLNKELAIKNMLDSMGSITFFCNLTSALGFFVFIFTDSKLLHEFSLIASFNVLLLFVLSYVLIPIFLSYAPGREKSTNKLVTTDKLTSTKLSYLIERIYQFTINNKLLIWTISLILMVLSIIGISKLTTESYILDDLKPEHKLVQDLHFFERQFSGVIPLEILIDTKKKHGATQFALLTATDSLANAITKYPELSYPLSIVDGLKFLHQSYYGGDKTFYTMPNSLDIGFLAPYLRARSQNNLYNSQSLNSILTNFVDSNKSILRLSLRIADIGQQRTKILLDKLTTIIPKYIDTSKNQIYITGDSIAFLAGNQYLLSGLKESILWATLFIVLIMFYLFRSAKITILSIIPNLLPIALSLGLLGFLNIPLRPSLVIIFSITLGIAVDITIRIMMHYREFLNQNQPASVCMQYTLRETGISIIYTTLILIIGFFIFMPSNFDSIRYLGIITTFTLFSSTLSNLFLLPSLLQSFNSNRN